jgi:HTH-type transcriptional regulator/antitoxin HipB
MAGIPQDRPDSMSALSTGVRARRRELRLRQADVADLAGVSTRFVEHLEAGKPSLQLDKVLAVLAVLGLEVVLRPGAAGLRVEGLRIEERS